MMACPNLDPAALSRLRMDGGESFAESCIGMMHWFSLHFNKNPVLNRYGLKVRGTETTQVHHSRAKIGSTTGSGNV